MAIGKKSCTRAQNCLGRCLLFMHFGFFVAGALSLSGAVTASRVDRLKRFTEAPPVIRELVYKIRGGDFGSNYVFFFAQWQTNAFSLRSGSSLERLTSGIVDADGFYAGRYETNYWLFRTGRNFERWTDTAEHVSKKDPRHPTRNSLPPMTKIASNWLSFVLNFGVSDVPIASINWEGDRFRALTAIGAKIDGTLVSTSDSPSVLEMKVSLVTTNQGQLVTNRVEWDARYTYGTNVDVDLPEHVEVVVRRGEQSQILLSDFHLLRLVTAERSAPSSAFDPGLVQETNVWRDFHLTAKGTFHTNAYGEVISEEEVRPVNRVGLFVYAFAAVIAMLFALVLRKVRGESTRNN